MQCFQYGQTEIDHLKQRDRILGKAIDDIGIINRQVTTDLFSILVKSVVDQQISTTAANTVWDRLSGKLIEITPNIIDRADVADIQSCGMSMRKAEYIKGISQAVINGEIDLSALPKMSDDEVINKLKTLRGIGIWSAEMVLIFSLCRQDVVSWGDIGIRRGMKILYGLNEITKEQFDQYRKRYSPYGSVASLYLWALSVKK
jgi:DNA-3-methyladenine glycosylase II